MPIVPKPTGEVPAATVDVDDVGADVDAAVVDAAVVDAAVVDAAVGAGAVVGACVVGAVVGGRVVAAVGRDDEAEVVLAPVEEDDGARDEVDAMVVVEVLSAAEVTADVTDCRGRSRRRSRVVGPAARGEDEGCDGGHEQRNATMHPASLAARRAALGATQCDPA